MNLRLWLLYGLRNLRSGLKGFWILLSCLTLGVAAIAVIGSLSAAIERGLAEQGQPLLGGDLEFSLIQRDVTAEELTYIKSQGPMSRIASLRAMATTNGKSTLVEIKAIDNAYPLYGDLKLKGETSTTTALAEANGQFGIAVDPLLLGRLGIALGDQINIGTTALRVTSLVEVEPDRISDGIVLGPRLLMSHEALYATGLVQPGSLVTWRYRIKLPQNTDLKTAKALVDAANKSFPDAGWRVRAKDSAASGAERFVERLGYFMTLVSIAALVVGGAGMANAVKAFVNRRMSSIATLKCMGLSNRDVFGLYLTEILLVGLLGITLGCLLGAVAPALLKMIAGDLLPLPVATAVNWQPLIFAAVLGFLVLLAFAIMPLARIANIRGAALFRNKAVVETAPFAWRWFFLSGTILGLAALLVALSAEDINVTLLYLAGLAGSFVVLSGLAFGLIKLVAALPRPQNILMRQALSALHRPGSASFAIILALGLGLSLFVTLTLTDGTISRELRSGLPEKAPTFFFLDVRNAELAAFRKSIEAEPGVTATGNAPMLRGRIVEVKGVPSDKVTPKPDAAWALRGDRGLTYSSKLPEGSELVSGSWWAEDYAGPPLVSVVDEIADGLGLKIGDKIKVNVLGRDVEAEVYNLRRVNWRSMGINFVLVFSPSTLQAAPHSHVVTVEMSGGDEAQLLNNAATAFPSVTGVRVKDALTTVSELLAKMLTAVRAANILTLLTGVLVLSGALAAGLSARSYEAVVLKTYGATRRQLLTAFLLEYGFLGAISALFGIITGSLGAWFLATFILEMPWQFSLGTAAVTAVVAMLITVTGGLLVTARALSAKPSSYLRDE